MYAINNLFKVCVYVVYKKCKHLDFYIINMDTKFQRFNNRWVLNIDTFLYI